MQNEVIVFGSAIKAIRQFYDFSQAEIATKTGLDVSAISFLEQGVRPPTLKTMTKVAHGLGLTVGKMLLIGERAMAGQANEAARLMASREGEVLCEDEVPAHASIE